MASSSKNIQAMNAALDNECPICQCDMLMPFSVPSCGHTFCFTCLKGVSIAKMGGCPICRGPIDDQIFKNPSQMLDLKLEVPGSPQVPINQRKPMDRDVKVEVDEDVKPDVSALNAAMQEPEKMFWLYQGRSQGWWRFDPRNEKDIEEAFIAQMPITEVTIVGKSYIIDFANMTQYPKTRVNNAREVKRVTAAEFDALDVKGLAGLYVAQ